MASKTSGADAVAPRILIVRVGAMGDVLHGLPAVQWLRRQVPGAYLGWAVEPRWASLLQAEGAAAGTPGMPLVDRVHAVPTREWSRKPLSAATFHSVLRLRRELRQERYTLAVDLQGSIRSSVICRLSGAPVVVGSAVPRERPAGWLYSRRVPTQTRHVIDQAGEIAEAALALVGGVAGAGAASHPLPRGVVAVDDAAERWAEGLVGEGFAPVVVLAPTAGWGAKQWPVRSFAELAAALAREGCRVLINGVGRDATAQDVERAARAELPAALAERVQVVDATVPQLTALLRRVALVVAGDTGPLHLAAALGTPAVALFGPTDPARNGPYFEPSTTLRDGESSTTYKRSAETDAGLERISADTVFLAAVALLRRGR